MPVKNVYGCEDCGREWYTDGYVSVGTCPVCGGSTEFEGPRDVRPDMSDVEV